jgi:hypothetical protein
VTGPTGDAAMKKPCADALLLLPHNRSPSISSSVRSSLGEGTIDMMIASCSRHRVGPRTPTAVTRYRSGETIVTGGGCGAAALRDAPCVMCRGTDAPCLASHRRLRRGDECCHDEGGREEEGGSPHQRAGASGVTPGRMPWLRRHGTSTCARRGLAAHGAGSPGPRRGLQHRSSAELHSRWVRPAGMPTTLTMAHCPPPLAVRGPTAPAPPETWR